MANTWPYSTQRWQRIRKLKLSANPVCEHCERGGRTQAASQVDHVQSINQGGEPFDLANLQSLCQSCHSSKTAAERLGKEHTIKGVDPVTGRPVDPKHPFNEKISQG